MDFDLENRMVVDSEWSWQKLVPISQLEDEEGEEDDKD